MRIGELARRTGEPAHRLRYYEQRGLLVSARGANGYREFGADAVGEVTRIRALLEAGLSTEDIASILPCARGEAPDLDPCPALVATLQARLVDLDQRLATITTSRRALVGYLAATRTPDAGPVAVPEGDAR